MLPGGSLAAGVPEDPLLARRLSGRSASTSGSERGARGEGPGCPRGPGNAGRGRAGRRALAPRQSALTPTWPGADPVALGQVRLVQQDRARAKRVLAEVTVAAGVGEVWRVLRDYKHLAQFVPNLASCERLPGGTATRYQVRQRGVSQSLLWRLEAGALLDCSEIAGTMGRREIHFTQLEGDFKEFSGRWVVEPHPGVANAGDGVPATLLRYEAELAHKWGLPTTLVSGIVSAGLPANIHAIKARAEQLANEHAQAKPGFARMGLRDEATEPWASSGPRGGAGTGGYGPASSPEAAEQLPAAGPARSSWPQLRLQAPRLPAPYYAPPSKPPGYLGLESVPLPGVAEPPGGADLEELRRRGREAVKASYPAFGLSASSAREALSEVHLRRLDNETTLHRRAVAIVDVAASPEEVWGVLTDYAALPGLLPNLAACEQVPSPPQYGPRVKRLRQVGYKALACMELHAEAVLDLTEKAPREVQFQAVAGDFAMLRGKWLLTPAAPPAAAAPEQHPEAQGRGAPAGPQNPQRGAGVALQYSVEVQIARSTPLLGLLEPLLEQVVYEDVPLNLLALKGQVEAQRAASDAASLEAAGEGRRAEQLRRQLASPTLADMTADFQVLALELERCYGEARVLPSRPTLRENAHTLLEKAIFAHGGHAKVAAALGWGLPFKPKKPRGHWDALRNVKLALDDFVAEQGQQPGVLPTKKALIDAGRWDLLKAVERWGGFQELAGGLGYALAPRVPYSEEWMEHVAQTAAATGLSGRTGLFETAARSYRLGVNPLSASLELDAEGDADVAAAGGPAPFSANGSSGGGNGSRPQGAAGAVPRGGARRGPLQRSETLVLENAGFGEDPTQCAFCGGADLLEPPSTAGRGRGEAGPGAAAPGSREGSGEAARQRRKEGRPGSRRTVRQEIDSW